MEKKKWSRNWGNFDWSQVVKRMEEKGDDGYDYELVKSKKGFSEFLDWLSQNDQKRYYKAILSIIFVEVGFDESQVEALKPYLDELIRILEFILKE